MANSLGERSPKRLRSSTPNGGLTDRISDLPICIIEHILSFLPTRDAIAFCTLSRQWDLLWTSIPDLLFYSESIEHEDVQRFASFVDQTLMLHTSSKINKLLLEFNYDYPFDDKLESWIRFAKSHKVEELCVHFTQGGTIGSWFRRANYYVTKMSLTSIRLFLYPEKLNICWPSLKILSLAEMKLYRDVIRSILLGSPLIESLTLCRCSYDTVCYKFMIDTTCTRMKELVIDSCWTTTYDGPMEIKGPNLISLTVVGNMHIPGFKLVDVSSLVEANIDFQMDNWPSKEKQLCVHKRILERLLQELSHVNRLTFGTRCLEVLSILRTERALSETSRLKIYKSKHEVEGVPDTSTADLPISARPMIKTVYFRRNKKNPNAFT